jgi:hypothetical protein
VKPPSSGHLLLLLRVTHVKHGRGVHDPRVSLIDVVHQQRL